MDDIIEIDLRKYIQLLIKRWWLIVGFAAILAVIAFVLTSLAPISYQAAALVAVTQPRYQLNFDPKIQTIYSIQPANNAYLDLATSDDVLKQVYDQWTERPADIKGLQDMRESVIQAGSGKDASILKLAVKTEKPEVSARLANLWALFLIEKANSVYFGQEQQLQFLEGQLANAQADLDQAEKALVDFQSQNQLDILTNQLDSALQAQKDYLEIQRNISYLEQRVQGLRSQLVANRGDDPTIADQLSALLLQIQTYNTQLGVKESSFPLQIQFTDPAAVSGLDAQAQIRLMDSLLISIQERVEFVEDNLNTLDPKILSLQQTVQGYQTTLDQLQRTREIAEQTYTTLAHKVDEVRITDEDPTERLQLASTAYPSSEPSPRNRLRNTFLAGFTGVILIVALILVWEWWRGKESPEEA